MEWVGGNACLRVDTGYLTFILKNQKFNLLNQLGFKLNNSIRIQTKQSEGLARDPVHARLIQSARDKNLLSPYQFSSNRFDTSPPLPATYESACLHCSLCWTAYSFTFHLVSMIFND